MIGLLLAAGLAASSPRDARVADMAALTLREGVNRLGAVGPDGAEVMIVSATPHVEVAGQIHTTYMVLTRAPGKDWVLAPFCGDEESDGGCPDTVSAAPNNGEDGTLATTFATARIDGRKTLVMIRAARKMALANDAYSPVPVDVSLSAMRHERDFDETYFRQTSRVLAPGCYVDASLALNVVYGLPLPAGYDGAGAPARCPAPVSAAPPNAR